MLLHLLEDIGVREVLSGDKVTTVIHAASVGEEGHGLGEAEYKPTDVGLPLGRLVWAAQLGDVPLDEGLLATQTGNGSNVGDGFNGELELEEALKLVTIIARYVLYSLVSTDLVLSLSCRSLSVSKFERQW